MSIQRTGAQIIWECLGHEGVRTVFGYPGGAILPAYDAMLDFPIRHVLVRHEQGATHMADGYARASGEVGVAMATSLVVYMDAPAVIDSAGDGMTRAGGAFKRLHGRRAELAARSEEVFGACGAAFIVPTALFLAMGGFDEDFFASHEDVDFSYRAQLRGWRCRYVAEAVVHHKGSATLGRIKSGQVFLAQRNSEWLYWKNTPGPLLVRSGLDHVVYNLAAAVHFARLGLLGTFLRAKWAALAGLGPLLRKRAEVQRARTVSSGEIWRKLEPRWLRLKLSEEKFEIAIARRAPEAPAPKAGS